MAGYQSPYTGAQIDAALDKATTALQPGDVDDTPANGETAVPVSSNWAFDHAANLNAHGISDFGETLVNAADADTARATLGLGDGAVATVQTSALDRTPGRLVLVDYVDALLAGRVNDIGVAGGVGFGVGIYPDALPSGFAALPGTALAASDTYGNYQYSDGSIACWIPKFYYRIGSASSPRYAVYGANAVDIASAYDYANETAANAAGFALHRAFKNAGAVKNGFMADKYQCSNNGGKASSLKNGNPLSSSSAHNPFSGLTGTPANAYYGAIDAAKTRGAVWHCMSRFEWAALALLALAHGQAATSATWCAWYDANRVTNFPKGNNNNALGDTNDNTILYVSDGYLNCGKTGSANYPAKVSHNGQGSGVMDLNGNMWEITLGMTRPGANASDTSQQNDATAFYLLKDTVDVNALTSGWSDQASGNEHWGTATHLATLYDAITLAHVSNAGVANRFGNGANQVLEEELSGDGWRMTGFGIAKSGGVSGGGSNLFGADYFYEYHRANLCLCSGGSWDNTSYAGVWLLHLSRSRAGSDGGVGFRSCCYPA